jgi:hypothetical protein
MASTTEEKPRGPGRPRGQKKSGGRQKGTPNKLGTTIAEVFRNLMGLDDAAVAETKKIDGKGYRCRRRLFEMLHGDRDVDPALNNLLKTCLSYGYGLPRRMEADENAWFSSRLAFITSRGLPWDQDPLAKKESLMLQQRAAEDALELQLEAEKQKEMVSTTQDASEGQMPKFDLTERKETIPAPPTKADPEETMTLVQHHDFPPAPPEMPGR